MNRWNATTTEARAPVVQRKCAMCGGSHVSDGECEDCKRKIGRRLQARQHDIDPSDQLEREAEQVADDVVRDHASGAAARRISISTLDGTQRNGGEGGYDGRNGMVDQVLQSPGERLDDRTRESMEVRFGHNFGDVRVHRDALAAQSARALNADAYTVGAHIAFAPGLFSPETTPGQRLIAHELTHVLQQRADGSGHLAVQRDEPAEVRLSQEPERCEGELIITQYYNDFVRDVPGLIQQIPNASQEQKTSLTNQARFVFQAEGAVDLSNYTILCCRRINTDFMQTGGESTQAYIAPARSELGMTLRVFEWMGEFRRTLDKEVLTRFLQIIAHEKRHVTLGTAIQVTSAALRPGISDSAARNAAYRAEEILATVEEVAVARMALGPEYGVPTDVQEKIYRSRNLIRGWVTEQEYQRLRGIIIAQLRDRYGFEDGCDTSLTVGVVRSMERGSWFSCDYDTGGIYGPVPDGLNVCTDERHRFCRRRPESTPQPSSTQSQP